MRAQRSRRRALSAAAASLAIALALVGCSPNQQIELDLPPQADAALPDASVEQLQAAVEHAMAASGSSGAIVGVWVPWSGSWVAGLGTQHPDDQTAVSADMEFRAGRLTRPMICDALYGAAADGKVRLDDSISDHVGTVPGLDDITLEQLCDSTSGIGSYAEELLPQWINNPERRWSPRELASFGLGLPRDTEPGAAYRDSDAGYVLLGIALTNATGMSATQLIDHYVAQPLGLEETRLAAPTSDAVLAGLYSRLVDGRRNCAEPVDISNLSTTSGFTDSGVVSDIDDLGRYAQALATGALQPGVDDRFADPLALSASAPSWLTVAGGAVQAGSLIGQFGAVPGYVTAAFADPATGLTVAVVLNNSAGGADNGANLAWELAAIASKAPAAAGETAPEAGLPWTAQQYHDQISKRAICAPAT